MGKLHHIIEKQKARIEQLERQVTNSVPVDQQDRTTIDGYDENGDPVATPPVTAEELTAELKTSADALNGAVAENQA